MLSVGRAGGGQGGEGGGGKDGEEGAGDGQGGDGVLISKVEEFVDSALSAQEGGRVRGALAEEAEKEKEGEGKGE